MKQAICRHSFWEDVGDNITFGRDFTTRCMDDVTALGMSEYRLRAYSRL